MGAIAVKQPLPGGFDRQSRQLQRLQRNVGISIETLTLFIRFWLTVTPPLPNDAQASAQAKDRERYEGLIEALGRRLAKGRRLLQEFPADIGEGEAGISNGDSSQEATSGT
jgi:hypothetical protein